MCMIEGKIEKNLSIDTDIVGSFGVCVWVCFSHDGWTGTRPFGIKRDEERGPYEDVEEEVSGDGEGWKRPGWTEHLHRLIYDSSLPAVPLRNDPLPSSLRPPRYSTMCTYTHATSLSVYSAYTYLTTSLYNASRPAHR